MPPELVAFIRDGGARAFAWGECDCCTWACDWVLERRGVDPAFRWRGRYRTALGAKRNLRRGLLAVASDAFAESGFAVTETPKPGDVGVVETPHGPALAIKTATGWAGKADVGVVVAPFPCLAAWTV